VLSTDLSLQNLLRKALDKSRLCKFCKERAYVVIHFWVQPKEEGPSRGQTQREKGSWAALKGAKPWPDPKEMRSWPAPKAIGSKVDLRRNVPCYPKRSGSRSAPKAIGPRVDPRTNGSCHLQRSGSQPALKAFGPILDLRRKGSCQPQRSGSRLTPKAIWGSLVEHKSSIAGKRRTKL
jgi:hypothetical protein